MSRAWILSAKDLQKLEFFLWQVPIISFSPVVTLILSFLLELSLVLGRHCGKFVSHQNWKFSHGNVGGKLFPLDRSFLVGVWTMNYVDLFPFCSNNQESIVHPLRDCHIIQNLWRQVYQCCRFNPTLFNSWEE